MARSKSQKPLRTRASKGDPVLEPGFLVLPPGGTSAVVFVLSFEEKTTTAGFALSPDGPFHEAGISWAFGPTPLNVTFKLMGSVEQLIAPAWEPIQFSPVFNQSQFARLQNWPVTEQFYVLFKHAPRHDPQMVITPT